jgi:AhpD family alkylhydroperoxidase
MPKLPREARRTLTADNFFGTIGNVIASGPALLTALVRPKTSAALREKVMLGVTSITDCRYCQWGHTHWAMAHGVSLDEVNQILGQQIEALEAKNPAEAAAILFAQHYAENLDKIDPESIESLRTYYSAAQVTEILAYVRAITLGSLTGNTIDAVLGRFRRIAMELFWWWPYGEVPEISARQVEALRKDASKPPQLIDVRTGTEWRAGHIAGAMHVPITELHARLPGLQLDGERPIIAICRAAHRSPPAVRLLRRYGFDHACQLQGGMLAWQQSGLPVEDGDSSGLPG